MSPILAPPRLKGDLSSTGARRNSPTTRLVGKVPDVQQREAEANRSEPGVRSRRAALQRTTVRPHRFAGFTRPSAEGNTSSRPKETTERAVDSDGKTRRGRGQRRLPSMTAGQRAASRQQGKHRVRWAFSRSAGERNCGSACRDPGEKPIRISPRWSWRPEAGCDQGTHQQGKSAERGRHRDQAGAGPPRGKRYSSPPGCCIAMSEAQARRRPQALVPARLGRFESEGGCLIARTECRSTTESPAGRDSHAALKTRPRRALPRPRSSSARWRP